MTLSRILSTILVAAAIAILGTVTFVSMGGYNVAATQQDSGLMRWLLHTTMQRSVSQRARSVQVPAQFTEEQRREGALDFSEMCVGCHGAPGEERGEIGKGLNPSPPNLAEVIPNWSSAEVFWILKNGIRMTGMPAFGPTHSDARLWSIVAFVMQLPKMTSDDYKKMGPSPREHEHQHEDGYDHQHH
jgi:mono/diheme cytochrome c family protein